MSRKTDLPIQEEMRLRGSTAWQKKTDETVVPIGMVIERFLSAKDSHYTRAGKVARAWEQVLTDVLRSHCSLAGFEGGILTVEADAGPFLHQLQMMKGRLLADMKASCPRCGLREIRILPGCSCTQKATI